MRGPQERHVSLRFLGIYKTGFRYLQESSAVPENDAGERLLEGTQVLAIPHIANVERVYEAKIFPSHRNFRWKGVEIEERNVERSIAKATGPYRRETTG